MQRIKLIISSFLIPVDYVMLILTGIFVYYLRYSALVSWRSVVFEISFKQYFFYLLWIAFLWLIVFSLSGLYALDKTRHFSYEFLSIFSACSAASMLVVVVMFFSRELFSSRFIILACWGMSIVFVSFGRILIHCVELYFYSQKKCLEKVIVFGAGETARRLAHYLSANPNLGYAVEARPKTFNEFKNMYQLNHIMAESIIQADPDLPKSDAAQLIDFCNEHNIIFKYVADIFGSLTTNIKTETLAGMPIVTIAKTALDGWGRIAKRLFDEFVSFFCLIILSPLFLIIAIIIKLDSSGPVFVKLERVGARGKKFILYKFRSMINNAHNMKKELFHLNERKGPLFKIKNDPRITNVGKFLRISSLDELPQLFNVLIGDMSLVGPRPHEPQEVVKYPRFCKQLLTIKPGITGFAQISGRSKLLFSEEAGLDIYYIENWSLLFDLQIILKTIPVVLLCKNVS